MSPCLWTGKIGEAWALEYYRRGPIAITTLHPRGSRDRFDLNDAVCLGLDITSSEAVQIVKEVVDKLASGQQDVLVGNPGICHTTTAIYTDLEMVEAVLDVNVFSPP